MLMKLKVKFRLFQISTYALVFAAIILMALLTGKYIETVGLFISFVALRYTFSKTYHSNSFWTCIAISIIIFIIAILFVPKINLSILACIVFGLLIDFIAYKYKDYQDNKAELKELTKPKPFSVDTCTENELIARCKELRLSEENTNLAVEFFIKKTKPSIIANKLCIDEKSVQRKKTRLKAKLNNK